MGAVKKLPKIRANFVLLVEKALQATLSPQLRQAAWARLSCDDSNLTEADELHLFGQLFPGQGVEEAEEGQDELGDVEPELGDVEEEELQEEACAADDEVEDVWEGEEVQEEHVADVQAESKDLSRFVALRLVYGSARGSDFAAAASTQV
eukprot:697753-Amphidinium_carterae.1